MGELKRAMWMAGMKRKQYQMDWTGSNVRLSGNNHNNTIQDKTRK
jgi:hypothetical protein